MKKIFLSTAIAISFLYAGAQIENPVKWTFTAKKISPTDYELHMTATLEGKWHIYSQQAGEGPVSTTFAFAKNPLVNQQGSVKEFGKLTKEYDENFKSVLKYFGSKVDFVQTVKLKAQVATIAKGTVSYMVCNDKKCLPPREIPFSIPLGPKS